MGVGNSATLIQLVIAPALVFVSLPGRCFAPEPPPEPSTSQRVALADSFLQARLSYWQKRLQLEDWKIDLQQATSTQLRGGTLGNIHWDQSDKTAHIRVLSAAEYTMSYRAALRDQEFTIVHELIHLELASLPRSSASRREEEYAVNHMADALLALDAQAGGSPAGELVSGGAGSGDALAASARAGNAGVGNAGVGNAGVGNAGATAVALQSPTDYPRRHPEH